MCDTQEGGPRREWGSPGRGLALVSSGLSHVLATPGSSSPKIIISVRSQMEGLSKAWEAMTGKLGSAEEAMLRSISDTAARITGCSTTCVSPITHERRRLQEEKEFFDLDVASSIKNDSLPPKYGE